MNNLLSNLINELLPICTAEGVIDAVAEAVDRLETQMSSLVTLLDEITLSVSSRADQIANGEPVGAEAEFVARLKDTVEDFIFDIA